MKKTLVTLLLLIATLCGFAQRQQQLSPEQQKLQTMMMTLDMTRVPTGVLYDKVLPMADILQYQPVSDNRPAMDPLSFHQLYYEYYNSLINPGQAISDEQLLQVLETEYNDFTHPLVIFNANVSALKTDAIDRGLVRMDNDQLFDNMLPETPYQDYQVAYATVGTTELDFAEGAHTLRLDSRFILGNNKTPISNITIAYDNGMPGTTISMDGIPVSQYGNMDIGQIQFGADAEAVGLTIYVTLANGQNIGTVMTLKRRARKPSGPPPPLSADCNGDYHYDVTGYSPDGNIQGDYSINGDAATGTYYVYFSNYNCASKTVTNPVLFIDGFDPSNGRDHKDIYDNYINKPAVINGVSCRLGDKLREDGYDIIILDYKNGGDYIEKNGLLVAKTIEDIYNRYAGTIQEDFVVIGPSMGAIVAQYGLAWMEHNHKPTHTRTYISFDGPHLGANVPIGLQNMVKYITNRSSIASALFKKRIEGINYVIDCPATQQMLTHHVNANSESAPAQSWYRTKYWENLSDVGFWPNGIRRVAIVNGNRNGALNTRITPSERIMDIVKRSWLGYPTVDWKVYSTSKYSREWSAHMYMGSLWIAGLAAFPLGNTNYYHTPNNYTSLDTEPGSFFNGLADVQIPDWMESLMHLLFGLHIDFAKLNNATFIPTMSSVDYYPRANDLQFEKSFEYEAISECANNSTFDWVYASNQATNHVEVNDPIGNWFYNEITNKPQHLGTYNNYVSGGKFITLNTTQTYTLSFPASYINWTVSPDLTIISGQGTNTVTVKAINNALASDQITATIYPTCRNYSSTSGESYMQLSRHVRVSTNKPSGDEADEENAFRNLQTLDQGSLVITPNPATDVWNVVFPANNIPTAINVFDISGKVVFSANINNQGTISIPCATLAKGFYMAKVVYADKNVLNYKLVKN